MSMRQVGCNSAWLRCRYRDGCGAALEQYVASCDSLVAGRSLQIHCMMYCMVYCMMYCMMYLHDVLQAA